MPIVDQSILTKQWSIIGNTKLAELFKTYVNKVSDLERIMKIMTKWQKLIIHKIEYRNIQGGILCCKVHTLACSKRDILKLQSY